MAGQGASEVLKAAKIKGSKHVKATTFVEVIISKPYPSHNVCCCFFFSDESENSGHDSTTGADQNSWWVNLRIDGYWIDLSAKEDIFGYPQSMVPNGFV